MNIEKKSESVTNLNELLFSLVKEETTSLEKTRAIFFPKHHFLQVKKAWEEKNLNSFFIKTTSLVFSILVYWFLPGWFLFALLKIVFSKELWNFTITKTQLQISDHRLSIRQRIISKPLNVVTIFSLVPIFLGFFDFLNQNQHLKKVLIEKNIPGLNIPTESVQWETFRYFNHPKKDFLELQKIQLSPNSLVLTKKLNLKDVQKTQFFGDQENFIASFVPIDKNVPSLNQELVFKTDVFGKNRFYLNFLKKEELSSNFSGPILKTKHFNQVLDSFYWDLDEIPLKLDSFGFFSLDDKKTSENRELWQNEVSLSESSQSIFESNENFKIVNQTWTLSNLKNNVLLSNQLVGVGDFTPFKFFQKTKIDTTTAKSDSFSSKNFSFWKEKQTSWFLKKALNNCNFSSVTIHPSNRNELKELISDLDHVFMEQGYSSFRLMSGYSYPDMNLKQVHDFLLHSFFLEFPKNFGLENFNFYSKNNVFRNEKKGSSYKTDVKIIFPGNPSFVQNYSFENKKFPKFRVKTGVVNFRDLDKDKKETLYNDLALVLSPENGLDWQTTSFSETKIRDKSRKNLRFLLQNYLSPLNPLKDSKQTIKATRVKTKTNFVFSKNEMLVPFLTPTQWQKIYFQNKNGIEKNHYLTDFAVNDITIPLVEISRINSTYASLSFDLNSTLDYFWSSNIFGTTMNPEVLTTKQDFGFEYQSLKTMSYKKGVSIYSKNQDFFNVSSHFNLPTEKLFSDNWEPVTSRSWFIISQISFAFVFFNFLKYIITDYFNELIWFIIDVGFALGVIDENLKEEIEILTGQRDKGFRLKTEIDKKFHNIAGIKTLLPEIAEIVWFLRNKGKDFSLSKNFPRGLLLLGPPGTGKTVLVQALAGEAKVPILTLSGGSLIAPGESGALKLELLFQEARQLAPCIVFIDEIDSLAKKRQGVMQNPMGGDEILSLLEPGNTSSDLITTSSGDFLKNSETTFFKKTENLVSFTSKAQEGVDFANLLSENIAAQIKQQVQADDKYKQEQLTLLIQLLIELDGLQSRKGVIVIGATNRPELLDSAILRPGRFDKIVELGLPSHEKRLEIFKLYGKIIGYDPKISWEYFSKRTIGFTAADLASIMNQSSIRAILNDEENPKHTLQTIEHGIDRITTSEVEKVSKKVTTLSLYRIAYYQAGKIVLSKLLKYHPPTLITYLWPRRQNRRSLQILTNIQKYFFQFARRCELEDRIIGSYGGKAAEILIFEKSPRKLSSFGFEDLSFAFVLACFIIEKWCIYSKSTVISALTQISSNKNSSELIPEKVEFFKEVAFTMELPPHLFYSQENDLSSHPFSQNSFSGAWWQLQISQELEFVQHKFSSWYRLYLPNPEEKEKNIEWSPPDKFYHRNNLTKILKNKKMRSITWNHIHTIIRDYQIQAFVLESFNKALRLLDENREYLDKLVYELVQKEVLYQLEIDQLFSMFIPVTLNDTNLSKKSEKSGSKNDNQDIKILNNSFGHLSRRKIKNWIDFADFLQKK